MTLSPSLPPFMWLFVSAIDVSEGDETFVTPLPLALRGAILPRPNRQVSA